MRTTFRRNTVALAAVVAAGAVAFSAPGMAKGLFDADNAHKVDGLHANQIAKTQYFAASTTFDNFNVCAFTPLLTRNFVTTHAGIVSVVGSVNADRDTDNANEGLLTTRVTIDGVPATAPANVNLENDGIIDATSTSVGAAKVAKGAHTLVIEGKECGTGMAFITSESLLASYSPFGGTATPPAVKVAVKSNR